MSENDLKELEGIGPKSYRDGDVLDRLYNERGMSTYEIADLFDIHQSTVWDWMNKNDIGRRGQGRKNGLGPATFHVNGNGYEEWKTSRSTESITVHRLLAISEYGVEAVAGSHIHHKNEIRWDNRPENIEVKSPHKHIQDHQTGENSNSKLTEEEVKEIHRRRDAGEMGKSLAEEFGVSEPTIYEIGNENTWTHLWE